jgi:hypothetical protein
MSRFVDPEPSFELAQPERRLPKYNGHSCGKHVGGPFSLSRHLFEGFRRALDSPNRTLTAR